MERQLVEFVTYRGDRLFDGAVDVSWLIQDREKARLAAGAFVFHGPTYHGVDQQDVGIAHGHRLIDTANFALQVIKHCNGKEERPFTLAIAGYGTGKSHLATTLSVLLSEPSSACAQDILSNFKVADSDLHSSALRELADMQSPTLVVSLNGMGNFDLAAEFTRQIMHFLNAADIDATALDALRPRFKMAASLVQRLTEKEVEELINECGLINVSDIVKRLQEHDETVYSVAHDYLSRLGFSIRAIGDETVKDVIDTVCREYIGEGRAFSRLVVLFDEFGRYAEFATMRSQIAGSGVLQQLFEGIQTNADKATFIGFIQFDLNTYVQRMGQEYRNEILRVSTRYQSAEKAYLSINLETLLANLLEKKDQAVLDKYFDCEEEYGKSASFMRSINSWFPQSSNHRLWADSKEFHHIIRKGCWPLAPYASWLLFHLAAAGQHLQQRSALSLLNEAFSHHSKSMIPGFGWQLHATDIWSEDLERELLIAEEGGNRGAITSAYANVIAKVGQHLTAEEEKLLRSVVLASKLGLVAQNRSNATDALAALSGLSSHSAEKFLKSLEDERNVLSWDDRFNQFEIIGDTASRPQFLTFLRQKVADKYDAWSRAQLFLRRAGEFCADVLSDRICDFAEKHNISTKEWFFTSQIANLSELPRILQESIKEWHSAFSVDQFRGSIIYCYVEPENDLERVKVDTLKVLKNYARESGYRALPILVVFIHDGDGLVGQCLAELTVLDEDLNDQDRTRFGNLVGVHHQKCQDLLNSNLRDLIKQQQYAVFGNVEVASQRLDGVCCSIFEAVYPDVLPFPFDGFSTKQGNAAETCHSLTLDLLRGNLSYNEVMTKAVRDKNRANEVLKKCWQIFLQNGDVGQRPNQANVRAIFSAWENSLKAQGGFIPLAELLIIACRPPFGANIASAGLLLGVYLCARQKIFMVRTGESQYELSELNSDMLFRGKYLDLGKLYSLVLLPKEAEVDSEWDGFLDGWESVLEVSYLEQIRYLEQSTELKTRVSPPRAQVYRISLLETKAKDARFKLAAIDSKVNNAYERIESAKRNLNMHTLTFSAVKLKEVITQMQDDSLYPQSDIDRYKHEVDLICQWVIHNFDSWLAEQSPRGRTTKDASDFERFMRETALNLKKLGLSEQEDKVNSHTANSIRQINVLASAQSLAENIEGWLTEHNTSRAQRVADLRNDVDTAKENLKKVSDTLKIIHVPSLENVKIKLNDFIKAHKQREKELMKRLSSILDMSTSFVVSRIDEIQQKVDDLEKIFERCDSDIDTLRTMRRALNFYNDASIRLCDGSLSENSFTSLLSELNSKAKGISEDEPPWMPEDVMPLLHKRALKKREELGQRWLTDMENEFSSINTQDIAAANNLHSRLQKVPGYLTKIQHRRAKELQSDVEKHLNKLKVEWLLEKYRELDSKSQNSFLKAIGQELRATL
ncbi:hypothetical protein [Syntrophorhabdus aromaticivorans]|uniref:hypothetical protein n=2 Tax=Syntrophorhabdus aromaticivorans TaxID=328301 RepID=UPI00041A0342|nr:hypothetical protein [Syntrophorhabdus aromaticivorans]